MNTSGEAADQVVRMSLEAGEAALKISGAGAQQLAVLLYAVLKEQKKTGGRARLETLVRSGKALTVFSVKESDLKTFVKEAKQYGILYCAIRNSKGKSDGMVDIMVKEEDAPRINRIVERFKFTSVEEAAKVQTEIQKGREEKGDKSNKSDKLEEKPNPSSAKTGNSRPSAPISGRQNEAAWDTSEPYKAYKPAVPEKPSVKKALKEIQASGGQRKESKERNSYRPDNRNMQAKKKSEKAKDR